jgi:N-acyl-D-amino-acid deacylase
MQHDLVIRNGTILDGTGSPAFEGDIAVDGTTISAIGRVTGTGREEIDARGAIVTPGFVDVHTHYDGQITWENRLSPSSGHGVTTVVMGNCGVGFAPVRPGQQQLAIKLMEGVEDIPEVVMAKGVPWNWETFPEYLDAIEQRHADIDFAAQLPHNPLRVYVMGERGAALEPATDEDLATMRALTQEAIAAGAIGVSTTRSYAHRFRDGRQVPSIKSEEREVLAIAQGLADAGTGVFQLIDNSLRPAEDQIDLLRRVATTAGRPVSFTLVQTHSQPDDWRAMLAGLDQANRDGLKITGQVIPRPVGMLLGLDLSLHPFAFHPSFRPIADKPLAEKVAAMRDPAMRARLLTEQPDDSNDFLTSVVEDVAHIFPLGDPPNYHPDRSESIAARAEAEGRDIMEVLYDLLLEDDGHAVLYRPSANRGGERFEEVGEHMMPHPHTILGLGDGGAHYGMICDAPYTTYVLLHWVHHPDPAKRIPLSQAIRMLSHDTARTVGLDDRGELRVGMKADLNVIDMDRLRLHAPRTVYDLPAGGRRLTQRADGYMATIVSGEITYRESVATGALPGRLVRGQQAAPAPTAVAAE